MFKVAFPIKKKDQLDFNFESNQNQNQNQNQRAETAAV